MLKDRIGVHAIAAGYVLGELSRLLLLLFLIARQKIFALDLVVRITPQVKDFLRTASYQVVCLSAVGLNPVIDKTMASWLAPGSVSILYYADRLYMIPVGLLSAGLFPVTLSHWSSALNSGEDRAVFVSRVNRTAKFALGFSLIMAVILMLLSQPMIQLIFGRGRFPAVSMPLLGSTWACYLLGLAPYIAGSMFTQAHLALKNTAFLMKAGFVNCVLNVLLNLVFMRLFGVAGIALATTITVMATAVILFISFSTTGRDNEKH
jgi:putative peptidoglycan lipid II flippase